MWLFLSLHQAYEKGIRYVAISEGQHQAYEKGIRYVAISESTSGFYLALRLRVDLDHPAGCSRLIALSVYINFCFYAA